MPVLRNLTLHEQGDAEVAIAAHSGFALTRAAEGVTVESGSAGLRAAAQTLAALFRQCAAAGEAALVGGHTGVWIAAVLLMTRANESLPELWYFDTRRLHDEQGRFIFVPEQLVRIS